MTPWRNIFNILPQFRKGSTNHLRQFYHYIYRFLKMFNYSKKKLSIIKRLNLFKDFCLLSLMRFHLISDMFLCHTALWLFMTPECPIQDHTGKSAVYWTFNINALNIVTTSSSTKLIFFACCDSINWISEIKFN